MRFYAHHSLGGGRLCGGEDGLPTLGHCHNLCAMFLIKLAKNIVQKKEWLNLEFSFQVL